MGTVYERSHLTIAASSSVNNESVLYDPSDQRMVKLPVTARWMSPDHLYLSETFERFRGDVINGSLAQRGWVLQEWVLSRRTLFFGLSQIHRACYHTDFYERNLGVPWTGLSNLLNWQLYAHDNSLASPVESDLLRDTTNISPLLGSVTHAHRSDHQRAIGNAMTETKGSLHLHFHLVWGSLVGYYSSRALTVTGDRAIALGGIKERLQTRLRFHYCNGHWGDTNLCFIKSLSWAVSLCHNTPLSRRAPTWSWLAEERSVFYVGTWYHIEWSAFGLQDYGMLLTSTPWSSTSGPSPLRVTGVLKHITYSESISGLYLTKYAAKNLRSSQAPDDPQSTWLSLAYLSISRRPFFCTLGQRPI
ncbi:hypothetical protein QBC36DRAFT_7049 [Triangularia setosa]|uniref:Heterokaryon incompatibility domain-containing protein n=1 Tax=Triangularia setosa TaxID=2587417 RepID=A0AAN7ACD8_9PEZI|nr:hypothetical protein QBC36DRAFT_7049 [Podospora setosa]